MANMAACMARRRVPPTMTTTRKMTAIREMTADRSKTADCPFNQVIFYYKNKIVHWFIFCKNYLYNWASMLCVNITLLMMTHFRYRFPLKKLVARKLDFTVGGRGEVDGNPPLGFRSVEAQQNTFTLISGLPWACSTKWYHIYWSWRRTMSNDVIWPVIFDLPSSLLLFS